MEPLPEVLEELRVFAGRGFLSQQQVDIVMARRDGASYDDIERRFGLSGPTALIHCLRLLLEEFDEGRHRQLLGSRR